MWRVRKIMVCIMFFMFFADVTFKHLAIDNWIQYSANKPKSGT